MTITKERILEILSSYEEGLGEYGATELGICPGDYGNIADDILASIQEMNNPQPNNKP